MSTAQRRNDIDWLRIAAVYLLFLFHVAMVFNPQPFYHVRNEDVSLGMMVLSGFISAWHMPLFFLLAGWSVFSSLESRGSGSFFRERVLKLFIPLLLGSALFGPPIKYLELRGGQDMNAHGLHVSAELQGTYKTVVPRGFPEAAPFHESYLEFLPSFFTSLDRFTWSHLWFLAYLFTFTLLYYPLFKRLKRRRPIERVESWWVYAPIVPLALIQVVLRPFWPGVQNLFNDWANFAYYSTYLMIGFVFACHPALEQALHRERRRALGVSLAAFCVLVLGVVGVVRFPPIILAMTAVAGWCFIVAVLGFANSYLQRDAAALPYLRESAFPIYILHQPAVVFVGALVVQMELGIAAKFAILLPTSIVLALAVYHFVVRPNGVLRFIHGMPPRKPPLRQPADEEVLARS